MESGLYHDRIVKDSGKRREILNYINTHVRSNKLEIVLMTVQRSPNIGCVQRKTIRTQPFKSLANWCDYKLKQIKLLEKIASLTTHREHPIFIKR